MAGCGSKEGKVFGLLRWKQCGSACCIAFAGLQDQACVLLWIGRLDMLSQVGGSIAALMCLVGPVGRNEVVEDAVHI
jgi:hypothetical protein